MKGKKFSLKGKNLNKPTKEIDMRKYYCIDVYNEADQEEHTIKCCPGCTQLAIDLINDLDDIHLLRVYESTAESNCSLCPQ